MGQRHQLFIIARLRPYGAAENSPPLYRCVAAFHSQWLYGCLALRSARRILTLIKKKENAEIVRAEIDGLQGKYGRRQQEPIMPKVPAPFTAFLLSIGTTINTENNDVDGYFVFDGTSFSNGVLSSEMRSWGGSEYFFLLAWSGALEIRP